MRKREYLLATKGWKYLIETLSDIYCPWFNHAIQVSVALDFFEYDGLEIMLENTLDTF